MSRVLTLVIALGAALAWTGCADNEVTLFIEHMKKQPEAPECSVVTGDPYVRTGTLDVAFGNGFTAFLLVTNHAMSREAYESGKVETNGVFIDYAEVYLLGTDGSLIGERGRHVIEYYIEPESSNVVSVDLIPQGSAADLQVRGNCPPLGSSFYPAGSIGKDVQGSSVPRSLEKVQAVVRLFGHTGGGTEVETQEYAVGIDLCCGCLVDWGNCLSNCSRLCDDVQGNSMCSAGVANGGIAMDCRELYHNAGATWTCPEDSDHEDTDSDSVRECNCDDCT